MHRLWAIVGVWLALGAADVRADEVEEAIAAAWADSEAGRCEQAWRRLSAIEGLESRAALLAGQCQIRRGRHAEALALLDGVRAASDLTPEQRGDVELYRGVALFHLERYAQADAALDTLATAHEGWIDELLGALDAAEIDTMAALTERALTEHGTGGGKTE